RRHRRARESRPRHRLGVRDRPGRGSPRGPGQWAAVFFGLVAPLTHRRSPFPGESAMVIPPRDAAMKIAVFGFGYVGTMTAACLAEKGHDVWGVAVDPDKVDLVARGQSPIVEPGLGDLVARTVAGGTLHATMSVADALDGADLSLVCVGTPSRSHGETDLTYVE